MISDSQKLPSVGDDTVHAWHIHLTQRQEYKYTLWRILWDEGLSVKDIAERLNLPAKKVNQRIYELRQTRGWFPRRNKARSKLQLRASAEQRHSRLRELWDMGLTKKQIADHLGVKSTSLDVITRRLRKRYPDWFPKRPATSKKRWLVTDPAGKTFEVLGLNQFCQDNKLTRQNLVRGGSRGFRATILTEP